MVGNDNLSYLLRVTYYVSFATKCASDFICDLNYYALCLCILLHSRLLLSIFGIKRDSPRNTTLLGDFSHPIFFVFPDSRICHNDGDKSSTRCCLYKEVDYEAKLYFVKH